MTVLKIFHYLATFFATAIDMLQFQLQHKFLHTVSCFNCNGMQLHNQTTDVAASYLNIYSKWCDLMKVYKIVHYLATVKNSTETSIPVRDFCLFQLQYFYRNRKIQSGAYIIYMGSGVPTGPRGGAHRARGSNIPTQRYHRYRVMHAGSNLRTQRALPEPTLL